MLKSIAENCIHDIDGNGFSFLHFFVVCVPFSLNTFLAVVLFVFHFAGVTDCFCARARLQAW